MKKIFAVVLQLMVTLLLLAGLALSSSPDSSLMGYWKFDENSGVSAADSSGNGRNGMLHNGPVWTTGKVNHSLSFDGNNDLVEVQDFNPPVNLSLEAWIFPGNNTGNDSIILSKNNNEYDFRINTDGYLAATVGDVPLKHKAFNFYSSGNIDKWYHVVYTFDNSNDVHKLYINGTLVEVSNNTADITNTNTNLWIGRHSQFNFGTFLGKIDEVRIYNSTLSASEVFNRYNSTV
ncbi:MAG: LamG domain-containing protein [Candidatus Aenigmarchaeota archaeon]|nr:LamG domain-containing protein [Candidatus Aenigmarchaeota archaeon]